MSDYNEVEMAICVASRVLEDEATVGVGTGAPCAAAMLAQKTHAPGLLVAFEAGGLGADVARDAYFCGRFAHDTSGAYGDEYV